MKQLVYNGKDYDKIELYSLEIEKKTFGYSLTSYVQIKKRIEPLKVEFFSDWKEVISYIENWVLE